MRENRAIVKKAGERCIVTALFSTEYSDTAVANMAN